MAFTKLLEQGMVKLTRTSKNKLVKINEAYCNTSFLEEKGKTLILILFVDDLLITNNHEFKIKWLIQQLECTFEMSNIGKLRLYLNVEFISFMNGLFMCQHTYILEIL